MDTIAAISTAPGQGAVALLRISGSEALSVADRVFKAKGAGHSWTPRMASFGEILDGTRKLDEVLVTFFKGPASFTGEDVVEVACHGGVLVTRRILELLLRSGARSAEPGEFTQRAFLNGKMDLTQAEAVMDLIGAQSDLALSVAAEQLEGRLGEEIRGLKARLLDILAHIEAYIDFPEDDIDPDTGAALFKRMSEAQTSVERLLSTASQGRVLREGARTVIYGVPNVGKSSLMNRLLGFERAIVSSTAGTTRDTIEEVVMLRGWPLRLIDTAGVRTALDAIEEQGIERTRKQYERADIIFQVADASLPCPEGMVTEDPRVILVLNKADLEEHPTWKGVGGIRVSCTTGAGFSALEEAVESRLLKGVSAGNDWCVAINARHQDCLRRGAAQIEAALQALTGRLSPEFVAEELRGAMDAVGEVVGRADTEELLGRIFATFCIGK